MTIRGSTGQQLFARLRLCLVLIATLFALQLHAGSAAAAPIIGITGTCDTIGNSSFVITNTGTAMTVDYSWELYQNGFFLTSVLFRLTAVGTGGSSLPLTINGLYGTLELRVKDQNNALVTSASAVCVYHPRVTINQISGQADPATTQPILFTATFDRPVTGFTSADVTITGMAATPGVTVTDIGNHLTYVVAVNGAADLETVQATIPANVAIGPDGQGNLPSTSTDNHVTYHAPPIIGVTGTCDGSANSVFTIVNSGGATYVNYTYEIYQNATFLTSGLFSLTAVGTPNSVLQLTINGLYGAIELRIKNPAGVQVASATAICGDPSVTINQATTQADPTTGSPILFDVVFSVPVNDFLSDDVQIAGMAGAPGITVTDSGNHRNFSVAVTGAVSGETIRATIRAAAAIDRSTSHPTPASTSTDNSVTVDNSQRVSGLVVDAVNSQLVTAALFGSGIWRSTNGGGVWLPAIPQPGNSWVNALLIDPTQTTRYFVATLGAGVYRSTNSGIAWAACGSTGLGSLQVRTMAISNAGTLVAATEAGVYKSTNCADWTSANQGLPAANASPVTALFVDPALPTTFYAGVDGVGIFKSTNGGAAWSAATTQPNNLHVTAFAIKPAGGGTLHAATLGGVYISGNGGITWAACATQPVNQNVLSLETDAMGVLYAGTGAGVAVSGDDCATWQPIAAADLVGTGPLATGQGNTKFGALAVASDSKRTLYAGNGSGTVQRTDVSPVLLSASVSSTTRNTTTLTLTSSETGKAFWIVVPRNSAAPTFAQVASGVSYTGVTVVANGSGGMVQNTPTNFSVTGLTAATDYDLYATAEDSTLHDGFPPVKRQFTTLPNTYVITVSVSPTGAGTASCSPNPVNEGSSSTCTAAANPAYAPGNWSGDCSGPSCVLTNIIAARSVTANFIPTLNVDGSAAATRYQPVTDGQIIVRYMQGVRGPALVAGAGVTGARVTDPAAMATYLSSLGPLLDVDGSGSIDPATDGLLIVRYMLGFRGEALIVNALGPTPRTRSTAAEIEAWLASLMP
jgi:hypothetical protein